MTGQDSRSIRVLLADDDALLRQELAAMLTQAGCTVSGQVGDARALVRQVAAGEPDVAVVDIRMPPTNTTDGLLAALEIRREHPQVAVLVLSQYIEPYYALQLLEHSDRVGYLLKERVTDPTHLTDAVRRLAAGGSVIDPAVVRRLLDRPRRPHPLDALTDRERDILRLIAEGRSNQATAPSSCSARKPSRPTSATSSKNSG